MNQTTRRFALLLAALALPSPAFAAGKAYVFLGGHAGNLSRCAERISLHRKGDAGASDVAGAVARTKAGEQIVVAGHSDGSIFASKFILAVKKQDPNAKISYVNFDGFRPNGGGRPDIGSSNVAGIPGVSITCVTMAGAPNYPFLRNGPGCRAHILDPPAGCDSWCRHYAVMSCDLLK